MSEPSKFKVECEAKHAAKFLEWLRTRGGLALWNSQDFGRAGESWTTAWFTESGAPTTKPHYSTKSEPDLRIIDAAEVGVFTSALFKEFPVRTRLARGGTVAKLQDSSQRNLDRVMASCRNKHPGCDVYWERGGIEIQDRPAMQVRYVTGTIPLHQWAIEKGL